MEVVQLIFSMGACDIDDIILNVFGSLLGFGVYYLFENLYKRKVGVLS
jgi:glycopeptide antibiotics resistance protein